MRLSCCGCSVAQVCAGLEEWVVDFIVVLAIALKRIKSQYLQHSPNDIDQGATRVSHTQRATREIWSTS